MFKTIDIKIIKRSKPLEQSVKPALEKSQNVVSKAQSERLLAAKILDWVRECREQRSEEIRNARSFFENRDISPNAL